MRKPFYITRPAVVVRKQNTIFVVGKDFKKPIPVEHISDVYCHAPVTVKSGAMFYLSKHGVPEHYFDKYGYYRGTFWPKEHYVSGYVKIQQMRYYIDERKRLEIAREMAQGIVWNLMKVLRYYENRKGIQERTGKLKAIYKALNGSDSINNVISLESNAWIELYNAIPEITGMEFEGRTRRPPQDEINAVISSANNILYGATITEIYNTYLDPSISYLHEPLERRFSLALDVADIFKPLLSIRLVFRMFNRNMFGESDFEYLGDAVYLSDRGKRKLLQEWDKTLYMTVRHRTLKSKVTYRRLIRLELYKLVKHVIGDKKYESFKIWW